MRVPVKGRVKTRLAAGVGDERALALYKEFAAHTLAEVKATGLGYQICFTPKDQQGRIVGWLGQDHVFLPQTGKDLGERMAHALELGFSQGMEKIVLVGTDIPDIRASYLLKAFDILSQKDMVLGPSLDGGYWLIGFRRQGFSPLVFQGVDWGSSSVFSSTIERSCRAGISQGLLKPLQDIDTQEDLASFTGRSVDSEFDSGT